MKLVDLLKKTILLFLDEILIQYRYYFKSINKLFKNRKSNKQLPVGLFVVISSDFASILLVIQHKTGVLIITTLIQKSNI